MPHTAGCRTLQGPLCLDVECAAPAGWRSMEWMEPGKEPPVLRCLRCDPAQSADAFDNGILAPGTFQRRGANSDQECRISSMQTRVGAPAGTGPAFIAGLP